MAGFKALGSVRVDRLGPPKDFCAAAFPYAQRRLIGLIQTFFYPVLWLGIAPKFDLPVRQMQVWVQPCCLCPADVLSVVRQGCRAVCLVRVWAHVGFLRWCCPSLHHIAQGWFTGFLRVLVFDECWVTVGMGWCLSRQSLKP